MLKNRHLLLFVLISMSFFASAQQSSSYKKKDLVQNRNVYFNQKAINPAYTDSVKFKANIGGEFIFTSNKPLEGIYLTGESEIESINSSFGIIMDYNNIPDYQNRSIYTSYSYCFNLNNNSKIYTGINLGLRQYKILTREYNSDDPLISTASYKWGNSPMLKLGFIFNYKIHRIGLSYDAESSKLTKGNNETILKSSGFIASYNLNIKASRHFSVTPELFACFESQENYLVFSCKADYRNIVSTAILYNTNNSIGIMASVLIKKRINLGYYLDYRTSSLNRYSYTSHNINLGIVF